MFSSKRSLIVTFMGLVLLGALSLATYGCGSSNDNASGTTANTINAASCSYADVSAAITAASSEDTIVVPAGSCVWTSTIKITKGVVLQGAGMDSTIITWGGGVNNMIAYQPANPALNEPFRLTGFTFDGNKLGGYGIQIGNMHTSSIINQIRIDHDKVVNFGEAIRFLGVIYGLVDNNKLSYNNMGFRLLGNDDNSWKDPLQIGSANYIYIEDNNISTAGHHTLVLSGWGSRWVFRYNAVDLTVSDYNVLDVHGNLLNGGNPQGIRGVVGTEVYDNTFTNANRGALRLVDIRGGTNMVFNNKMSGTVSKCNSTIVLREEDDNTGTGYPIKTTYPGYDPVKDTYLWNNTLNGNAICLDNEDGALMISEKRDYWSDTQTWNGGPTNYFSTGLSSDRPAICSNNDVYWETDTKKLYRCERDNNWTFIYKPYTYPHPLRGG